MTPRRLRSCVAEACDYPLHLGVTEAGTKDNSNIKSSIGIGALLLDGIGDTIRVSLTEDSPREIAVCNELLEQLPSLTAPRPPAGCMVPCAAQYHCVRRGA